jgi:hypothetical protein
MSRKPLIVLEFNELTPSLMTRFIDAGELPNFAKLRNQSQVYTTQAEERSPYLEPWIQWVTVHSGLNFSDHGIFHLDEGHKLRAKRIWDVVSERGMKVFVCGSMNVRYDSTPNGGVLPDPWCTKVRPLPDSLEPYFRFVQRNVLEHTNEQVPLSKADYFEFLRFMMSHGLSASTVIAILKQLSAERSSDCRWKRVVLLDLLQFDVFQHYYRRLQPAFSTFFLNSTAHYQHAYWDSMEPEAFGHPLPAPDKEAYRDAILFGYQRMDAIVGRFLKMVGDEATLVLCTALSQEPWLNHADEGAGSFYRPKDFVGVARHAGLTSSYTVAPVMTEQFHLEFQRESDAVAAEQKLLALHIGGEPVMFVQREGTRLFTGCARHDDLADDVTMTTASGRVRFFDVFYRVPTSKTGMHNPAGILWIRQPGGSHRVSHDHVPLAAVAPTLLRTLGVEPPEHMRVPALTLS